MKKKMIILVAMAAALAMTLSGCSAIMFGLGSIADASTPDSILVTGCPVDTLRAGTMIHVIKTEGDTISGKFLRTNPQIVHQDYWAQTLSGTQFSTPDDPNPVTSILVRHDKETSEIPVDEIEGILWYPKKNSKYVGLAIGACFDALLIYGIATWEYDLQFDFTGNEYFGSYGP